MRLQEHFQIAIRSAGYSVSAGRSYWDWIKRFIRFHKIRHPDLAECSGMRNLLTGNDILDFPPLW
ncbi:phage integrase N-terminal SAM-like domain-containing protein [Endozoicomonas acroporae]|uniref:phage integrase N-terminal SAM-like domain-containing protein n=1 Tax=Endozoicomonas acroporae TaxID=1701104 RepID=UPI0013D8ABA3|nr:phage integrase N-terminal SAM-like domain-containing protein [Endozoicomonas acroporae]